MITNLVIDCKQGDRGGLGDCGDDGGFGGDDVIQNDQEEGWLLWRLWRRMIIAKNYQKHVVGSQILAKVAQWWCDYINMEDNFM